jgi:hypothetical protein
VSVEIMVSKIRAALAARSEPDFSLLLEQTLLKPMVLMKHYVEVNNI